MPVAQSTVWVARTGLQGKRLCPGHPLPVTLPHAQRGAACASLCVRVAPSPGQKRVLLLLAAHTAPTCEGMPGATRPVGPPQAVARPGLAHACQRAEGSLHEPPSQDNMRIGRQSPACCMHLEGSGVVPGTSSARDESAVRRGRHMAGAPCCPCFISYVDGSALRLQFNQCSWLERAAPCSPACLTH